VWSPQMECWYSAGLCVFLLSPGVKVCETLLKQGGSDEAFLMEAEEMSALAHGEPARSHL